MKTRLICILIGLAAAAAVGPAAASAASTCATAKPKGLTLKRDVGRTVAQLRWQAPRHADPATAYRVTAGRAVVGQTRKRSIRVRVRIGARQRFTVTPIRSGKPAARCAASRLIRVQYQTPGAPQDVTAEIADGIVRVAWKAARRGDRPVAGYRVYRDDDLLGQQATLSRDVKVAGDRTYRFSVRAVDRRGRVGRSSATATVVTANQRPPAPTGVQAEALSPSEVSVHWQPSVSSQNDVVGYRVFRNGAAVGQFQATAANLQNLPASTLVTVTVAAVDARGVISEYSEPATVRTFDKPGAVPPPAPTPPSGGGGGGGGATIAVPSVPAGLQAKALSESEVKLTWQPSSVAGGRVVGYRVRRNGVVVGQFQGTETTVSNLAASTGFTFTVAAVSSQGMVSAESDPASATTLAPAPTTGTAQAFVLASTDQSFADFRAHYKQIGTIYPTYYDCTGSGDLTGQDDPLITSWAQARKVKVLPRINCQRTAVLTDILRDPTMRERWLTNITQLVQSHGYDGIAVDFEAGLAADRDAFTSFVTELAKRLHAMDKRLTVAVSAKTADNPDHPRSGFFDYEALDDSVDTMFVMDWGIHWSTSVPGPQSDLTWATKVADYVASLGAKDHYVLGTMLYGMDWPDGGGPDHEATALVYGDLMEHLTAVGAESIYDATADEWHATYTDADGVKHDVWYPDAKTIATRVQLAHDRGLAGVGFWRIGREDARIWDNPLIAPGAPWPGG